MASAAPTAPEDFGAETIAEPEVIALPPELVEDRGEPALPSTEINAAKSPESIDIKAPQKRPHAAKLPSKKHADMSAEKPSEAAPAPGGPSAAAADAGSEDEEIENSEETTSALNANDMEITSMIKTFSKMLKRNYIVDQGVKGKITIHQPTPVSLSEALRIFESVLLLKGFTTVPLGNNTYKVVPAKDARQTTIPLVLESEATPSDALVTQLLRLKYVQAEELQTIVSQFVSKDGLINTSPGTNSLVLIDSAANIERLTKIIKQLDVPAVDQDITIIPIEHAEAKDVAEKILEILGEKEGDSGANRSAIRPARPATTGLTTGVVPAQNQKPATGGGRRLPLKVIPDERTNSLIIVADQELTAKVRALTEQLDSSLDRSGGRFYVYRLKHADAEELAGILSALISGGTYDGSAGKKETGSSLSRSSRENRDSSSSSGSSRYGSSSSSRSSSFYGSARGQIGSKAPGAAGDQKVSFEGEVNIAPDPSTNSLIINASRTDYAKVKSVIDELDIKRRQVIVEATLLEVTLDKNEGMGVEMQGTLGYDNGGVIAQTNFGGLSNLLTNPSALSDLSVAAASTGTLTLPGGVTIPSQAILISAVSRNTNVNVLSSPTILTTDNEEAEIIVGQNVPFLTGTSTDTTNLNNTFNQIERQDVGITLRITPQISTGDFVTLRIFVEISDVVSGTQRDPNGPTTTIRTSETTVEVKDNQMIVTGGLISDAVSDATRGVPFFEDIPVLGQLFKRQDQIRRRTNLLVFLTPKIIGDQFDARETALKKRTTMATVIGEPDDPSLERKYVLENKRLDNVAEELPPPQTLPSTITAPSAGAQSTSSGLATSSGSALVPRGAEEQAAIDRLAKHFKALGEVPPQLNTPQLSGDVQGNESPKPKQDDSAAKVNLDDDEIEVTVTPKLPGQTNGNAASRRVTSERGSSHNATQAPAQASRNSMATSDSPATPTTSFVVLRDLGGNDATAKFPYADDQGTVGIIVNGTTGAKFFEAGGRYTLDSDLGRRTFVCLGRYASEAEARLVHPVLGESKEGGQQAKWHTLAPYEIISLGRGAWRRG